MLTGSGTLMLEVLSEKVGANGAVVRGVRDELWTLPLGPNAEDAQASPAPKSESSPEPKEYCVAINSTSLSLNSGAADFTCHAHLAALQVRVYPTRSCIRGRRVRMGSSF